MASLYANDSIIGKPWNWFSGIFSEETKPTAQHLFEVALSVPAPDGFQSVQFSFDHFISEISSFELHSFYYALNESKISLSDWMKHLTEAALPPPENTDALILSSRETRRHRRRCSRWRQAADHAANTPFGSRKHKYLME